MTPADLHATVTVACVRWDTEPGPRTTLAAWIADCLWAAGWRAANEAPR